MPTKINLIYINQESSIPSNVKVLSIPDYDAENFILFLTKEEKYDKNEYTDRTIYIHDIYINTFLPIKALQALIAEEKIDKDKINLYFNDKNSRVDMDEFGGILTNIGKEYKKFEYRAVNAIMKRLGK